MRSDNISFVFYRPTNVKLFCPIRQQLKNRNRPAMESVRSGRWLFAHCQCNVEMW